ncbi:hypothetical protein C8R45DRAFT_1089045 [Mycena sanguinolenta]|nr:hypothetical protein C8R45DRAFT_1089045 [Mycena sanguinolenta]
MLRARHPTSFFPPFTPATTSPNLGSIQIKQTSRTRSTPTRSTCARWLRSARLFGGDEHREHGQSSRIAREHVRSVLVRLVSTRCASGPGEREDIHTSEEMKDERMTRTPDKMREVEQMAKGWSQSQGRRVCGKERAGGDGPTQSGRRACGSAFPTTTASRNTTVLANVVQATLPSLSSATQAAMSLRTSLAACTRRDAVAVMALTCASIMQTLRSLAHIASTGSCVSVPTSSDHAASRTALTAATAIAYRVAFKSAAVLSGVV